MRDKRLGYLEEKRRRGETREGRRWEVGRVGTVRIDKERREE